LPPLEALGIGVKIYSKFLRGFNQPFKIKYVQSDDRQIGHIS